MPFTYSRRPYFLEELKNMTKEEVINKCSGIIVDNKSLLENLDLFLNYSLFFRIQSILLLDYESVLILEKLKAKEIFKRDKVYLLDDGKQIDRSYIDTTKLKNITLIVPNTYAMWGVKFDNKLFCYQYLYVNKSIENDLFHGYYDRETLLEVERIASMIKEFSETLTEVEKVILISNYLQKYCEFKETEKGFSEKDIGDLKTALFYNIGVCRTFADATTLLSNNPYLKLKVRNVRSKDKPVHVWNIIELNGKLYQIDNSRAISNGKNTKPGELKTSKFNSEYLLFGQNSLKKLCHEEISRGLISNTLLSKEDFDRDYLEAAIEYLEDTGIVDFDYEKNKK